MLKKRFGPWLCEEPGRTIDLLYYCKGYLIQILGLGSEVRTPYGVGKYKRRSSMAT